MLTRLKLRGMERWQRTLWIMFFAQMCSAVGYSIIFPFLPLYVEDLGTHTNLSIEFWAGMVFSAQAVTMMIASPVWGALADRYGRKLMVERATFGGTIIISLMAFAGSAEELVILRAIQGMITGTVAAANALVAANAPRHRTGYAMGVIQVSLWSGVALGPLIGGVLADMFGFRVPFLITGGMLFFAGLMVHFGVQEDFTPEAKSNNKKKSILNEWRGIFAMPGVPQTYTVRFLAGLSRSMLVPITPLFVAYLLAQGTPGLVPSVFENVTSSAAHISTITGLVVGIASFTATFSGVYLGRLGDKIGHRQVLIGSSLAAIAFYLPQAFVTQAWQLIILQGLAGLAVGGIVAAPSALLAQYTHPGEEGAVYGLDNSVLAAARAIAPLVGASVAFWLGLRYTFAATSILFGVMLIVVIFLLPKHTIVHQQPMEMVEASPLPV
ncbi:MAG: MFS transporter [Phototrophicales bacterium]